MRTALPPVSWAALGRKGRQNTGFNVSRTHLCHINIKEAIQIFN